MLRRNKKLLECNRNFNRFIRRILVPWLLLWVLVQTQTILLPPSLSQLSTVTFRPSNDSFSGCTEWRREEPSLHLRNHRKCRNISGTRLWQRIPIHKISCPSPVSVRSLCKVECRGNKREPTNMLPRPRRYKRTTTCSRNGWKRSNNELNN